MTEIKTNEVMTRKKKICNRLIGFGTLAFLGGATLGGGALVYYGATELYDFAKEKLFQPAKVMTKETPATNVLQKGEAHVNEG